MHNIIVIKMASFNNLLLIITVFAFFAAAGFANSIAVSIDCPKEVLAGDSITAKVTIENQGINDLFSIFSLGIPEVNNWIRIDKDVIKLNSGESGAIDISISPPKDAEAGTYSYDITIDSMNSKQRIEKEIIFIVRKRTVNGVIKDFSMDCIQCKENIGVSFSIKNAGTSDLENVKAVVKAGGQQREFPLDNMGPGKDKGVKTTFSLKNIKPDRYKLNIDLYGNGKKLDSEEKEFIIPVIEGIDIDKDVSSNILGNFIRIKAVNRGNGEDKIEIKSEVLGEWWAAFIGPEPYLKEGGEWTWKSLLKPGESTEIVYREFYWPIPIVFVAIIIAVLYLYVSMTSMSLTKSIINIRGGSEVSISLRIRNRGRDVEKIVVRDIIKPVFSVLSSFESLKPIARKTAVGTELLWKIDKIKHNEERVLHYKLKARVGVKNNMKLPASRLSGQSGERQVILSSNKPVISGIKEPEVRLKLAK